MKELRNYEQERKQTTDMCKVMDGTKRTARYGIDKDNERGI